MQEEKQVQVGSLDDPDNPQKALSKLQNKVVPSAARGKIIYIPWDRTKFICPNHRVNTVINMSDSAQRGKANKMEEFECSCETIYIRTKDQLQFSK